MGKSTVAAADVHALELITQQAYLVCSAHAHTVKAKRVSIVLIAAHESGKGGVVVTTMTFQYGPFGLCLRIKFCLGALFGGFALVLI